MEDQRLLASAALFRQLHDKKKDVYDVLSQFINTSIILNKSWHFNVTDVTTQLLKDFSFRIPEAVVKACLRNRLKREGYLTSAQGLFSVTEIFDTSDTIISNFESVKDEQEIIKSELIEYVSHTSGKELDEDSRKELMADFYSYFINGSRDSTNAIYISQFIIKNSKNEQFTTRLNTVEEGLLLYSGINYSSGLMNHQPWKNDFQLFLDTEILFDAVGLNGTIHQKIFLEFNTLIKELSERSTKKVKIELKYFEETKREIDDFFYAAEKLVERNKQPDPHRSGMIGIVNGCTSATDILAKKSYFYDKIRQYKITLDDNTDYYSNAAYNMESLQRIEKLKHENSEYDDDKIADVLRIFTKINHKRKGVNNRGFESSGALLITGKNITKNIAYSIASETSVRQAQFAYDLDFITERLWFKLNKGFGGDTRLPTTFDVVARAQVILSAQAGDKVAEDFRNLRTEVEAGRMTPTIAGHLVSELRSRTFKPEDFIPEDIEDTVFFMRNDFIETTSRNITLLEQKAHEGEQSQLRVEQLAKELAQRESENQSLTEHHKETLATVDILSARLRENEIHYQKESYKKHRSSAVRFYIGLLSIYYIISFLITAALLFFIITPSDTLLSIITSLAPLAIAISSAKKSKIFSCRLAKRHYRKSLEKQKTKILFNIKENNPQSI